MYVGEGGVGWFGCWYLEGRRAGERATTNYATQIQNLIYLGRAGCNHHYLRKHRRCVKDGGEITAQSNSAVLVHVQPRSH